MKYIFIIAIAASFLFSSCEMQLIQEVPTTHSGSETTNSLTAPLSSPLDFAAHPVAAGQLTVSLSLNKTTLEQGETMEMNLIVHNAGAGPLSLHFSNGFQADFSAHTEQNPQDIVWRYLDSGLHPPLYSAITIDPHGSKTLSAEWKLTDSQNHVLIPGSYVLTGTLLADGNQMSASLPFTIHESSALVPFQVIRTAPYDGAVNADASLPIALYLNKAIDRHTLLSGNIALHVTDDPSLDDLLALSLLTYDQNLRKITVQLGRTADPQALAGKKITISVSGKIHTVYGEGLEPFTFSFTIGSG